MKGGFICAICKQSIGDPYQQIEKRLEYRRVQGRGHHRVILLAHMCLDCTNKEVTGMRMDIPADQGTLL